MTVQPPTPPMDPTYPSQGAILPTNSNGQVELRGSPYTPPEDRGTTLYNDRPTEIHPQPYSHHPNFCYPSGQGRWHPQASLPQYAPNYSQYPLPPPQNVIYAGEDYHRRERSPATRGKIVKQFKEANPGQKSRRKKARKGTEPDILPPNWKPLSVLAENYPDFDDGATEAHVRRGKVVREHENNIRGKPKRSLNSFILYRSHFNGVAKEELKRAARATAGEEPKDGEPLIPSINPRVSEYVARSWRNETMAVGARFVALAAEDEKEHRLADPTYKYTPKPKSKSRSKGKGRAKRRKNNRPDSDDEDDTYFSDGDIQSTASHHHTPQAMHPDSGKSPLPGATGQDWVQAPPSYLDPGDHHYHQQHPPPAYQQQPPSLPFQQAGQELQACLEQPRGYYQRPDQREPTMTVDPRMFLYPGTEDMPMGLPSSTQFTPGYADGGEIEMPVGQIGIPYPEENNMEDMLNFSP